MTSSPNRPVFLPQAAIAIGLLLGLTGPALSQQMAPKSGILGTLPVQRPQPPAETAPYSPPPPTPPVSTALPARGNVGVGMAPVPNPPYDTPQTGSEIGQQAGSGPVSLEPPARTNDIGPSEAAADPALGAAPVAIAEPTGPVEGMGSPEPVEGYVGAPPVRAYQAVPGQNNSGVAVGSLGGVDGSSVGLSQSGYGTLGPNLWQGATRTDVERYLPNVPLSTGSPVMNDLTRQLLLSGATPPAGGAENARSLLAVRLERLTEAGQADLAWELARTTQSDVSPDVSVARARAALAVGKDREACDTLKDIPHGNDPAHDVTAAFSTKLSAFCQLAAGQSEQANMTLDLAREQGYDDPLFSSLVLQAANGLKLKAEGPSTKLDILDIALYRVAKRDLPANAGDIAEPAAIQALSRDENLSPETRIKAGERAAVSGLIQGEELARLYRLAQFTAEDRDGLKTGTYPASGAMRRALLFQAIEAEAGQADRVRQIKLMLSTGKSGNLGLVTVKVLLPILTQIAPGPATAELAPAAVRAFLLVGDRARALQWYDVVTSAGSGSSAIAFGRDARELRALIRISDPQGPVGNPDQASEDILVDLRSQVGANRLFGAREAALLQALGYPLPPEVLQQAAAVGSPKTSEVLEQLKEASRAGAIGKTIMLSLIALGRGGPDGADRDVVAQSVSSLKAVHLGDEARRLATEALMGHSYAGPG